MNPMERKYTMSFIRRLKSLLRYFKKRAISDVLWLELLESGATSQEIQWHFGTSEGLEARIHRFTSPQRRQYALYTTHLSSRMAMWWVLKQRQDRQAMKKSIWQALAYPLLLFGMAFIMILLLNHIMVPRISGLFDLAVTTQPKGSGFQGLTILEIIYILIVLVGLLAGLIPSKVRNAYIIRFYHHPMMNDFRFLLTTRFVHWLIKGLQQGLSAQTILTLLTLGGNSILRHWASVVMRELEGGHSLADAIGHLDPSLKVLFVIQDEEQSVDMRLSRHYRLMLLRVDSLIKRWRTIVLGWGYLSFGYIIFTAYQIMFEPIRQLEQLL